MPLTSGKQYRLQPVALLEVILVCLCSIYLEIHVSLIVVEKTRSLAGVICIARQPARMLAVASLRIV